MLQRFGISALAERPYTTISGRERQLAVLARALAQEPDFVVLDGPTAGLDFGNQGKVLREVRGLADSGHGALFVTRDRARARRSRTDTRLWIIPGFLCNRDRCGGKSFFVRA